MELNKEEFTKNQKGIIHTAVTIFECNRSFIKTKQDKEDIKIILAKT